MTTEMEDRLRRVLRERANSISTAPAYRLAAADDEDLQSPRGAGRGNSTAWRLTLGAVAAAAAAVIALVLATGGGHPAPVAGRVCAVADVPGFTAAARAGRLPGGTSVLSGSADGRELIAVHQPGLPVSVDVLRADGTRTRLWTAPVGERVRVVANPYGAVGSGLIAFEVDRLHSSSVTVLVADQQGKVRTLPVPDPGYVVPADALTAPIAGADSVTVLERSLTGRAQMQAVTYWPEPVPWQHASAGRATRVEQLLDVGGNLVFRRQLAGRQDLRFADAQYRPTTLPRAARTGYAFSSDGTTLSWLTHTGSGHRVWGWRAGEPNPRYRILPAGFTPQLVVGNGLVAGRFAGTAGQVVFDASGGALLQLPPGDRLVRSDGPFAVLALRSADGTAYSRVLATALTDCGATHS